MSDERLAELRRLAGDKYVVFRRSDHEQRQREMAEVYEKGTDTVHRKKVDEDE